MGETTLHDIIVGRSKLSPKDEIAAWHADRTRAESVYLSTIRLCDERMMAAAMRMNISKDTPND